MHGTDLAMTTQPAAPPPPPEAHLIEQARLARGLRPDKAAELLPESIRFKGGRWRQIEKGGYQKDGKWQTARADDMQLAHMAHIVGITTDQLENIKKHQAAEILRGIQRNKQSVHAPLVDRMRDNPKFMRAWERLNPEERKALIDRLDELDSRVEDDLVTYAEALGRPRGETAT